MIYLAIALSAAKNHKNQKGIIIKKGQSKRIAPLLDCNICSCRKKSDNFRYFCPNLRYSFRRFFVRQSVPFSVLWSCCLSVLFVAVSVCKLFQIFVSRKAAIWAASQNADFSVCYFCVFFHGILSKNLGVSAINLISDLPEAEISMPKVLVHAY